MRAHEQIYDVLYAQQDRWFSVKDMVTESGLGETTVRRAFHHLDAAGMVEQRQLNGRTQYSILFIPVPVTPAKKKRWFRRSK